MMIFKPKNTKSPRPIRKWIWINYLQAALVPLVLVELVFISIYFLTNQWTRRTMVNLLTSEANQNMSRIANMQSTVIQKELADVANVTKTYAAQTASALKREAVLDPADAARLAYSDEGAYYTTADRPDGGAAVFFSGFVPINAPERDKAARVLQTQFLMKDIQKHDAIVSSIYFNTYDSLNVIYPYFDVISQYMVHMDIPTFNFYYEADAAHNPERGIRWTEVYLDPAGHGWMASSIAPVYNGDFLEGVVGLDITVSTIAHEILDLVIPWDGYGILVGEDGTILALPGKGEQEWGLNELTSHSYSEAILEDTFKPDKFNLYKREDTATFASELESDTEGFSNVFLGDEDHAVAWATIPETGWKLIVFVPEKNIYAQVNRTTTQLFYIGFMMIAGLVLFYMVFFFFIYKRSRRMSLTISQPLAAMNELAKSIGEGRYYQDAPSVSVQELDETAGNLVKMGRQLGEANDGLLRAQNAIIEARDEAEKASRAKSEFLSNMSHELRTPLNAVLGFAQLLELINEVLDLSRIESGKITVESESVVVSDIMDEVVALVKPLAEQKEITLNSCRCAERDLQIEAGPIRLKQVLINLLTNAVKYNNRGGTVDFYCEKLGDMMRLHIEDNGIGIPEAELQKICEPFYRPDYVRGMAEGTGIGLTLVKQLTESMGGKVFVESVVGKGSHFYVEFKVKEQGGA